MAYKAKLRPKTEWQQDNCIGWWLGCRNKSVEEAVHGNAVVRCCQRERCMLFAVTLAVEQADPVEGPGVKAPSTSHPE